MVPLEEEWHPSRLKAFFQAKCLFGSRFYPSALVGKAGKPFLHATAIGALPLEQRPAPAYTKTVAWGQQAREVITNVNRET